MSLELGIDLNLGLPSDDLGTAFCGPATPFDLQASQRTGVRPAARDLETIGRRANLIQALILRLMTARGELAALGHPGYGSRHHELIGEPNTEGNRNLLKLHVLECLSQEPRVEIEQLDVLSAADRGRHAEVRIEARLRIIGEPGPLNLVVPFSFAGIER